MNTIGFHINQSVFSKPQGKVVRRTKDKGGKGHLLSQVEHQHDPDLSQDEGLLEHYSSGGLRVQIRSDISRRIYSGEIAKLNRFISNINVLSSETSVTEDSDNIAELTEDRERRRRINSHLEELSRDLGVSDFSQTLRDLKFPHEQMRDDGAGAEHRFYTKSSVPLKLAREGLHDIVQSMRESRILMEDGEIKFSTSREASFAAEELRDDIALEGKGVLSAIGDMDVNKVMDLLT